MTTPKGMLTHAKSTRLTPNSWPWVFGGLLLVLLVTWATAWVLTGRQVSWPRFHDDAYYYFKVAQQFASGNGLTVDGIHPTNGFHPLWMSVLIAVFALTPEGLTAAIAGIQIVIIGMVAGTGAVLMATMGRQISNLTIVAIISAFLFARILTSMMSGTEAAPAILLVSLFILVAVRTRALDDLKIRHADWIIGVLLGLSLLARLDLVFLALSIGFYLFFGGLGRGLVDRESLTGFLIKGVRIFVPTLVLVGPYLAWNHLEHGSIVPISGTLKSSFPMPEVGFDVLRTHWVHVSLILPVMSGLFFTFKDAERFGRFRSILFIGLLTIAFHSAYTQLYVNWSVYVWYFAAYIPFGMLGVGITMEGLRRWLPAPVTVGLAVIAICAAVGSQFISLSKLNHGFTDDSTNRDFVVAAEIAGQWVSSNMPEEARFAMKDSGAFSFHSLRNVSNLDGIIMNKGYYEILCTGQLQEYLSEIGVEYFVAHNTGRISFSDYDIADFRIPCRMPGGSDSLISVSQANEVYRSLPYFDGSETRLMIWRLAAQS